MMKNDPKIDNILNINDKDFAADPMKALGVKKGDTLNIMTPQFNRSDGLVVSYIPTTPEEYAALPKLSDKSLCKIGLSIWEKENGKTHWLYPAEWYDHIPAGTEITDICGHKELFKPGKTDNDRRGGALAYGFITP